MRNLIAIITDVLLIVALVSALYTLYRIYERWN